MELQEAQKKAIEHVNGPMMVLAAPGSGKTMVITHRTKYLIEKAKIRPEDILVITFTKAAAKEMKQRFETLMDSDHVRVTFGTFHGIFYRILQHAYHYNAQNILRENEKYQMIKYLLQQQDVDLQDEKDTIFGIISEISYIKGNGISVDNYYSNSCANDVFKNIYLSYVKWCRKIVKIDFDDMLLDTYELFKQRKDILAMWQKRFPYILIDEFQDINPIQYEIVKMLVAPNQNLFIVGDDDQSIYRFRGAKPEIMLGFDNDFENVKKVYLEVNYRCSETIVKASKSLISHNKKRFEKKITAFSKEKEPVHFYEMDNEREESSDIVNKIRNLNQKGTLYSDIAVLFRTGMEGRMLVRQLMEYNIPFRLKDGVSNIYDHFIAKNIISYIKLALGDYDRGNLLTIINRPLRYLSRDLFQEKEVDFSLVMERLGDKDYMIDRVKLLMEQLTNIRTMTPYAGITYIRKVIGYEEFLKTFANERHLNVEDYFDIYTEIQEMAKPYQTYKEWLDSIEEYKETLKEAARESEQNRDSVLLSTFHAAKGLEFDSVFLMNVCEGMVPHKKAVKDSDLEEERRMFYVAVTRAKRHLYIYNVKEVLGKAKTPSRFLSEMKIGKEELQAGSKVKHNKFGKGMVLYSDEKKIMIQFEKSDEVKTFQKDYILNKGMLELLH